jgi:hypothetical protein
MRLVLVMLARLVGTQKQGGLEYEFGENPGQAIKHYLEVVVEE